MLSQFKKSRNCIISILFCDCLDHHRGISSSIYWTGPYKGVRSPIEACALGGGGICSLKTDTCNVKTIKTLMKLFYGPLVI